MKPLIEIKTVPVVIEMKVTDAKLEYKRATAELEIARDEGGVSIQSRPIKLNLDTFESRNFLKLTAFRAIQKQAQKGQRAAYQATASYAQQGQLLLHAQIGQELITQFAEDAVARHAPSNIEVEYAAVPPPDISWTPNEMNIRYEMDKLSFDWRMNDFELAFTPSNIELSVEQYPEVTIEYVGGIIYVPPSSDPNYTNVDTEA